MWSSFVASILVELAGDFSFLGRLLSLYFVVEAATSGSLSKSTSSETCPSTERVKSEEGERFRLALGIGAGVATGWASTLLSVSEAAVVEVGVCLKVLDVASGWRR